MSNIHALQKSTTREKLLASMKALRPLVFRTLPECANPFEVSRECERQVKDYRNRQSCNGDPQGYVTVHCSSQGLIPYDNTYHHNGHEHAHHHVNGHAQTSVIAQFHADGTHGYEHDAHDPMPSHYVNATFQGLSHELAHHEQEGNIYNEQDREHLQENEQEYSSYFTVSTANRPMKESNSPDCLHATLDSLEQNKSPSPSLEVSYDNCVDEFLLCHDLDNTPTLSQQTNDAEQAQPVITHEIPSSEDNALEAQGRMGDRSRVHSMDVTPVLSFPVSEIKLLTTKISTKALPLTKARDVTPLLSFPVSEIKLSTKKICTKDLPLTTAPGNKRLKSANDILTDDKDAKKGHSTYKPDGKAMGSKHLVSERKRRKKINEKLYSLRAIVPRISKMDKSSIVGDAIAYLQELQKQIEDTQNDILRLQSGKSELLQNEFPIRTSKGIISTEDTCYSFPKNKILRITVSNSEKSMFQVGIWCKRGPDVLMQLTRAIEAVNFDIVNVNVATTGDHIINTIVVKVNSDGMLKPEEVKEKMLEVVPMYGFTFSS